MKWSEYPVGTKAYAISGGYWERVERGWKWCTGSTFPTPGGDVDRQRIELPALPPAAINSRSDADRRE